MIRTAEQEWVTFNKSGTCRRQKERRGAKGVQTRITRTNQNFHVYKKGGRVASQGLSSHEPNKRDGWVIKIFEEVGEVRVHCVSCVMHR